MKAKRLVGPVVALAALAALFVLVPVAAGDTGDVLELVPNTAVLLAKVSGTGGGGNGGTTSSTSSATNIFAPASYVDYHQVGGEPTTIVDRYPFDSSFSCQTAGGVTDTLSACQSEAACPAGQSSCYHDIVYVSNPLGLGEYSQFYSSYDGGQTFRVPPHNPYFYAQPVTTGAGGGDSHQAVGQVTHSVFFVDLSGACVTMNVSRDLGQTWSQDDLGCAGSPGVIDDRQWVAVDETGGLRNVYMNFNNDSGCLVTTSPGCSIVFVKSTDDGGANTPADFAASACNAFTMTAPSPAPDDTPTACPDPSDPNLYIAGAVQVDTSASSPYWHTLYIPFERSDGTNVSLWVAISTDQGDTWTRHLVANLGPHDAANIFPDLTIDTGGNLYYTWSQAQGLNPSQPDTEGETDVYYTYSQGGGLEGTWAAPIDITKETGDSAIFPWMVAGSPGQVDLVLYKANTGLNPNIAFTDTNGQPDDSCSAPSATCIGNTTVWNTYFGQSQNALNSGANFKLVQISDHPIHQGGVCTQGIACQSTQYQNRDLLDFLTIDVDHTGAAYTTWADDNNDRHDTRQFFSRQIAGASIFAGQNIAAVNSYPITDHAVTDPAGDVSDAVGLPNGSCAGMDLLGTSESQSNGVITVTLTLNAPPTAAAAVTCSREDATGGVWGAEFWASGAPVGPVAEYPDGNYYIGYRDNPPDGTPRVEAGYVDALSPTLNHDEFDPVEGGTLGGTCFAAVPPAGACTVVLTAPEAGLGIKPGAGLYSISGFSTYYFGTATTIPATRVPLGNTNLADIATPFDDNGTGTN
jgi:hypothetical protein